MIAKTDPCPECGVWTETDSEKPGLQKTHYPSHKEMICSGDCKACAERNNKRFFDLGVSMARRTSRAVFDAITGKHA